MTARRGSLSYKIVRLARRRRSPEASGSRFLRRAGLVAGRGIMLAALLCLSLTVGAQVWRVGMRNVALHQQIVQMDKDNANLQASNDELAVRVTRLHDPEYLVPLIHEQLGLTKPNEVFIEVTPPTPLPAQP